MSDSAAAPGQMTEPPANEPRLESWGEIAAHLRRDVRTVQRWERYHGLPVRRLQVGKLATVYAFRSELDKWFLEHQPKPEAEDPHGESIAAEDVSAELAAFAPGEEPDDSTHPKSFGVRKILVAGLILLGVACGTYVILHYWHPIPPPAKTRLFVRPFANHSGDPKQDEFTEGLTDEINTQLGKIAPRRLGVIAPTSSKILASKSIDELRRDLNVQYVLEGSVRRGLNQVRIDTQLISTSDQTQVWVDSFTNDPNDILQAQDEVAAAVAKKILVTFPAPAAETSSAKQIDPEAFDAYLAGRRFWANRDLRRSINFYEKALEKKPDYVPARAGLAGAYVVLGEDPNDGMLPAESVPKAREEARRALSSDPANVEAHCVLANIAQSYDWDYAAAERGYKRALALEPNNPMAHQWYAEYLIVRNRIPEAQEEAKVALDSDPVSPVFYTSRLEAFYYARDFDAAIAQAQLTLEQYPNFFLFRFWLGSAYRERKMYPQAIEQFDLARKETGNNPAMLMAYGHALAVSGDKAGARKVLAELQQLSKSRYVPPLYFAVMYTGLGELDQAFAWLDKAYGERNDRLVYLAVEPIADPLRPDPRYRDLISRLHLP